MNRSLFVEVSFFSLSFFLPFLPFELNSCQLRERERERAESLTPPIGASHAPAQPLKPNNQDHSTMSSLPWLHPCHSRTCRRSPARCLRSCIAAPRPAGSRAGSEPAAGQAAPVAAAKARMEKLFFWGFILASSARFQPVPAEQGAAPSCPPQCHCEEDGIMLSVDCSELGLSEVPANLSPLTAYL